MCGDKTIQQSHPINKIQNAKCIAVIDAKAWNDNVHNSHEKSLIKIKPMFST